MRCSGLPSASGLKIISQVHVVAPARMHIDQQRGVDAVEGDGLAYGRVDDLRRAEDLGGMAAERGEIVDAPDFLLRRLLHRLLTYALRDS